MSNEFRRTDEGKKYHISTTKGPNFRKLSQTKSTTLQTNMDFLTTRISIIIYLCTVCYDYIFQYCNV